MQDIWTDALGFLLKIDVFWVYFFVFIYAFVEVVFPPFPGDILVILAGILVKMRDLPFGLTYLSSVTGAYMAAVLVFFLGYAGGRFVFEHKFFRFILPDKQKEKVRRWMLHHSIWYLSVSRFFPGIRSGIILMAGLFKVDRAKATGMLLVSILLYNGMLIALGYFLGGNLAYLAIVWKWINRGIWGIAAVFFLTAVLLIYRKKKKA